MKKISLFITAFVLGINFAYFLKLPAVLGNSGELIPIEAYITPGNGGVFVYANGSIDANTFSSIEKASECASKFLGIKKQNYNFYVKFVESGAYAGPSGGAGFALSFIASFLNKSFNNFTITGTIDENCNIGSVGGIFQKINSSKNLKLIILPKDYDLTYFIASKIFKVKIAQARNISEAFEYAFLNKEPQKLSFFSNISLPKNETPTQFQKVAYAMYSKANKTFAKLNYSFDLDKVLSQDLELIKRGYSYAGANDLFSKIIYANVILAINSSFSPSLVYSIASNALDECERIQEPSIGISDYELVVSGMQRKTWGENKLKQVLNQNISSYDDAISALVDVETAKAWCESSKFFFNNSFQNNAFVLNQTKIMKIAEEELENATQIVAMYPSLESQFYLSSAQDSFAKAKYAEAIIDAKWAIAFSSIKKPNSSFAIEIAKLYGGVAKEYALQAQIQNSTQFAYLAMLVGDGFFKIKTSFVPKQNINYFLAPMFFLLFLILLLYLLTQKTKTKKARLKGRKSRVKPRT